MNRTPARNTPRRLIPLAICALTLASLLGHFKRQSIQTSWIELHAALLSPLAEHFAREDRRNASLAQPWLGDFGDVDHFAQANHALPPGSKDRIILYGDSITEFWPIYGASSFFPGHGYLNRGIRGQATPELLWRFRADVLDLHPGTVVLLGGANDILLSGRSIHLNETERNLQTMMEAAQRQHIRVILCQLTPILTQSPDTQRQLTRKVHDLNAWLRAYSADHHIALLDYFDVLANPDGSMRPELSLDGIHPNAAGYALMRPLVQQAIDRGR